MSYNKWITYGYGICVDDIKTTPEKLLKLAAMQPGTLENVREYLNQIHPEGYEDADLTLEDFDDLEGDYCERGVVYILNDVIREIPITYADDYNGSNYLLYSVTYPWCMSENEKNLREKDIEYIFKKYVQILTDEPIEINYYDVENDG